jgi:HK97 family phage portal protein
MPHLERITYGATPSRWGRMLEALRSFTIGPMSLKDPRLREFFGMGRPSASGVSVSESTALNYAAVWQAVTLIAGDIGSLPLFLYKRDERGGKTRYVGHPLYELLHTAPNPEMSSMTVRETMQAHVLTWGNGYAEIERDGASRPIALWPLLPTQVQPFRDDRMNLKYRVRNPDGEDVVLDPANMLHLHGLGYDGTMGYSVIAQARESLGLLAASEQFGASFFGNGSTFGGTLTHPKNLGPDALKNLRESVTSYHKGSDKAHRFLILEEGMSYARLGVEPNDAQFLETRQFQIAEVARWFNLPLHKLREMKDSSVRANIEQEALDYFVATLRPWLVRWEQELNRKLISPRERFLQLIEFNLDGVLRGDMASRYASYAVGRQWGWLSQNDVRDKENMPPITDGDVYLSPMNMVPSHRLDEVIDKQVAPAPAPVASVTEDAPAPSDEDEDEDESATRALVATIDAQGQVIGELRAGQTSLSADVDAARMRAEVAEWQTRGAQAETDLAVALALVESRDRALAESARERQALSEAWLKAEAEADSARARVDAEASAAAAQAALALAAETRATEAQMALDEAQADIATRAEAVAALTHERDASREASLAVDAARAEMAQARTEAEARAAEAQAALDHAQADLTSHVETIATLTAERDAARAASTALDEARLQSAQAQADAVARAAEAQTALALADEASRARQAAYTAARIARDEAAALLVSVSTSARAVVIDVVARLVRRESEKARAKRGTADKLRAWAETFYDDVHEADTWAETLRPVVALHQALVRSTRDAETVAREMVAAHFALSKRQILAAAVSDEFDAAVTATLNRWDLRAAEVADAFVREEMAHVRTIQ